MEVEGLIVRLGNRDDIDLVFHRPDRSWLHRGRIDPGHNVVTQCPSCGAQVGAQLVMAGEKIPCQYCNTPLETQTKPSA